EYNSLLPNVNRVYVIENKDGCSSFKKVEPSRLFETLINILLNNIIVIFDYVWNQLHNSDSLDKWSEKEKLLTIYLWLLFQSKYSRWMITSIDFSKIKLILEDLK
ncbi:MAG: hypothetical protein IJE69_02170, partial [Alistipes sp.]|nr:hypothetical protein [Alistipes sp.]